MSSGGSKRPSVVIQQHIFGGSDVVEIFSAGKQNRLHYCDEKHATREAGALAMREKAHFHTFEAMSRESKCPHCGRTGDTQHEFGMRMLRGERKPQSWCRKCRRPKSRASE